MSYYNDRKRCLAMLKGTILSSKKPIKFNLLKYAVFEKFGFTEKQTKSLLDSLEEVNIIKEQDGFYSAFVEEGL